MQIKTKVCDIYVFAEGFGDSSECKEVTPIEFIKLTGDDPYRIAAEHFKKLLSKCVNIVDTTMGKPVEPGVYWYQEGEDLRAYHVVQLGGDLMVQEHSLNYSNVNQFNGTWLEPLPGPGLVRGLLEQLQKLW